MTPARRFSNSAIMNYSSRVSDGRGATVDQLLIVARRDHAVVVAAEVRHVSDGLQSVLLEDERPALEPLETTEDLEDVLAVVGRRHRLAVDADVVEALDSLPRRSVDDQHRASRRLTMQLRHEHLRSIHRKADMERARALAHPSRIPHILYTIPVPPIAASPS